MMHHPIRLLHPPPPLIPNPPRFLLTHPPIRAFPILPPGTQPSPLLLTTDGARASSVPLRRRRRIVLRSNQPGVDEQDFEFGPERELGYQRRMVAAGGVAEGQEPVVRPVAEDGFEVEPGAAEIPGVEAAGGFEDGEGAGGRGGEWRAVGGPLEGVCDCSFVGFWGWWWGDGLALEGARLSFEIIEMGRVVDLGC